MNLWIRFQDLSQFLTRGWYNVVFEFLKKIPIVWNILLLRTRMWGIKTRWFLLYFALCPSHSSKSDPRCKSSNNILSYEYFCSLCYPDLFVSKYDIFAYTLLPEGEFSELSHSKNKNNNSNKSTSVYAKEKKHMKVPTLSDVRIASI